MELQPADALEAPVEQAADAGHQAKREGVAEPPVQFGHVQEIHAVDAGDRGRHGEDRGPGGELAGDDALALLRSEEHTSELQSLMRISYAVFCLKKKNT